MGVLIRLASQWVAGERLDDALAAARTANARGREALINFLGEHYHDAALARAALREYLDLVEAMVRSGVHGCISVKPTQLGVMIDPELALSQSETILDATRTAGQRLWLDMESSSTTEATIQIYMKLLERHPDVGLCLQANLRRTETDLGRLLPLGAKIRLTKGAYRESSDIAYTSRAEVDRQFLRCLEILFQRGRDFAVASHDGAIIQRTLELAATGNLPFEFQMLQGVRDPLKDELVRKGHRVLEYIPYGPMWLPYFMRRLRERPRNIVTMARSFVSG